MQLGPTLRLDSLRSLSPEAAEALAASNITYLELTGLKTLSAGTARALARSKAFNGSLPSLTELSADAAAALGTFAGNKAEGGKLNLLSLTTLDAEAARGLAAFKGKLELDGLTEIDPDTAAALAKYAGPKLSLGGLKTLSAETAEQLVKGKHWNGALPSNTGLETPDAVEIAKILAASPGSFSIPHLERVSPRTLTTLIGNGNVALPSLQFIKLIAEPDGSPNDDFVIPDDFPARGRRR